MWQSNYYQMLDVSQDASAQDIKKAFRQLALRYHPDHNPGDVKEAEGKFIGQQASAGMSMLATVVARLGYIEAEK